ncbi:hypothetical protein RRG08_027305 [Elysia crispata]|uniref:DJ-1/PfpI domain-containing protein n=1 Tax=Elysia crispata TaxID=231223 RepID=A0AAE0Z194_9GAST|nr:hypothetical protein RRG08_027305 [Elysia crispata]
MAKKVGILVEYDFEDAELVYPYDRFQEAGFNTVLIGPKGGTQYKGKHGYPLISDVSSSDISAQDLVALIMPGGWAPDRLRRDKKLVQLVKDMDTQEKTLAAICHGPWMLCSAKIIKGRHVTSFVAIKDDIENAGGIFKDEPVVVDKNIITSRTPRDLPVFCKAILKQIEE